MSFERIQYYYEAGLWSKPMVKTAVRKGVITREQYRDITGEDYRARRERRRWSRPVQVPAQRPAGVTRAAQRPPGPSQGPGA